MNAIINYIHQLQNVARVLVKEAAFILIWGSICKLASWFIFDVELPPWVK